MAKDIKYKFNPDSLSYERLEDRKNKMKTYILHLISGVSIGFVFFVFYLSFFKTPKEARLEEENVRLRTEYNILSKKTDEVYSLYKDLEQRDNNLYRAILQADTIPSSIREGEYQKTNRYYKFKDYNDKFLIVETYKKVDRLQKMAYVQSKSYDELRDLFKNQSNRLSSIPAIQPILNKDLKRISSGFGYRIDPVYHYKTFHAGVDFSSPIGTDVYSTGKGKVEMTGWVRGYGNVVKIAHGFGYESIYGHLSKILCKKGQTVKRGEVIAEVGNTGKSTGPHLHYEIRYKGKAVNPINFFFIDLSPSEYDYMVQMSSNFGQTLD